MSPRKLLLDVALRFERLQSLDDVKVGHGLEGRMLGRMSVLLGDHNAFLEQVFEDSNAILLGHQHVCGWTLDEKVEDETKKFWISTVRGLSGNSL